MAQVPPPIPSSLAEHPAANATDPVGCCCGYYRCTPSFTQAGCASDAQFGGWTYTWHEGACTSTDHYPATDRYPAPATMPKQPQ